MAKKKAFNGGSIVNYEKSLISCIKNEESFTTISSGLSRRIVYDNGVKVRFFGSNANSQLIEGAFLVQMVQRDIDKFIDKNGIPHFEKTPDVQQFNVEKIKSSLKEIKPKPILGLDINACYWNVAFQKGYISESLYNRGLALGKKKALLISIGCLNKMPLIKRYEGGRLISKNHDLSYCARYAPFYWNILAYTHDMMMETYGLYQENWYMFLTDCIFVDAKRRKDIQQYLQRKNLTYKTHQIKFRSYEAGKLDWFDFKGQEEKSMFAMNRDIALTYPIWKISKGIVSHPPTS